MTKNLNYNTFIEKLVLRNNIYSLMTKIHRTAKSKHNKMRLGKLSCRNCRFFSGCVLEKLSIDFIGWQLDVAHHRPSNKAVFHRQHMRIFIWIYDANFRQFYIQILVHRMKRTTYTEVIFKFYDHVFTD